MPALLLAAVMVLTLFPLPVYASVSGHPTRNDYESYYPTKTAYGMPRWTVSNWDSDSRIGYMTWNNRAGDSSNYLKLQYPKEIYLDKSETLEGAGYMYRITAHYGDTSTNYRIIIGGRSWGEFTQTMGDGNNNALTMTNIFDGYGHVGTVTSGNSMTTNDDNADADFRNNSSLDSVTALWYRTPNALDERLILLGSVKSSTATGSYQFSTSGWGGNFGRFDHWEKKWVTKANLNDDNKGNDSSHYDGTWREIVVDIIIYDKAELNRTNEYLQQIYNANSAYSAFEKSGQWSNFYTYWNNTPTLLRKRETTQSEIDSHVSAVNNVISQLRFAADDSALLSVIAQAEVITNEPNYELDYTAEARATLENALNAAKAHNYSTTPVAVSSDINAGKTAYDNQQTIDGLKAALSAAMPPELAPADFSAYDSFKTEHTPLPYGICYTAETLTAYNDAVAAVESAKQENLTYKNNQPQVDTLIAAVTDAFDALVVQHNYPETWTQDPEHVANCHEQGKEYRVCQNPDCDSREERDTLIDPQNHVGETVVENQTTETCGVAGYTGDTRCLGCNEIIQYGEEIPATEAHTWEEDDWVEGKEPGCTTDGTMHYICSVCAAAKDEVVADSRLGHAFEEGYTTDTEPTCTSYGWESHHCTHPNCNETEGGRQMEMLPHSLVEPEEWLLGRAPTCLTDGSKRFTCENCSHTEDRVIEGSALGHDRDSGTWRNSETNPATCTEDGYEDLYCGRCAEIIDTRAKMKTGHRWATAPSSVTAGTCITQATATYDCLNGCGEKDVRETGFNKNKHEGGEVLVGQRDATCSAPGYTGDKHCGGCNDLLETGQEIEQLDHTFTKEEIVDEPWCEVPGLKQTVCAVCGTPQEGSQEEIPALPHSWSEWSYTTEPSCTAGGEQMRHCTRCLEEETQQVDPKPHNYSSDYTVDRPATCTTPGSESQHCQNEGCKQSTNAREIATIPHSYTVALEDTRVRSTCSTYGYVTMQCDMCHTATEVRTDTQYDPTNHESLEYIPAVAKTCTTDGSTDGEHCTACGVYTRKPEVIPMSHDWDAGLVTTEGSCRVARVTTYTCTACKTTRDEIGETDPNRHLTTEFRRTTEPSCTQPGVDTEFCTDCGTRLTATKEVEPTGHTYGDWRTTRPSTCITPGTESRSCIHGDHTETRALALGEHTKGVWTPTKPATCTDGGTEVIRCTVCQRQLEERSTRPLGHQNEVVPGRAPTCRDYGYGEGISCKRCGQSIVDPEILPPSPDAHVYDNGTVVKKPTVTEKGQANFVCQLCGHIHSIELDLLAHVHMGGEATCSKRAICTICGNAYGELDAANHKNVRPVPDVDATCTTDGHIGGVRCLDCGGYVEEMTILPAKGHQDADGNGYCDVDGRSIYDTGDGSSDGVRCSFCAKYEASKDVPFIGWIYALVHFFVHMAASLRFH